MPPRSVADVVQQATQFTGRSPTLAVMSRRGMSPARQSGSKFRIGLVSCRVGASGEARKILNTNAASSGRLIMTIETGSDPRGLWRLYLSPPSRRPAQRGRGAWLFRNGKVRIRTMTLASTSTLPRSHRIGRGRPPPYRPNPPSELAQQRATRMACPTREGVRIRSSRRDNRQVAVLPGRANCTLRTPVRLQSQRKHRPAKRRPSEARSTHGRHDRVADDAERGRKRLSSSSLHVAPLRAGSLRSPAASY
jgi:hypothetical protein